MTCIETPESQFNNTEIWDNIYHKRQTVTVQGKT